MQPPREFCLSGLVLAALGFTLYAATSHPHPDWLDGPELARAAIQLGVFHPPGSPLAVLLGHLAVFSPLGSAWSLLRLFSALFAAGSLFVLCLLARDLWRSLGPQNRLLHTAVPLVATAAFALTPGIWSQAVRYEVYTLAFFLCLCALREAVRMYLDAPDSSPHRIHRALAFVGMGIAVHPLMALAPLAAILPLLARSANRSSWWHSLPALFAGAVPLFLLPLLARLPVDSRWGDLSTLTGWLHFVLGTTFSGTFSSGETSIAVGGWNLLLLSISQAGAPLLVLALAGVYLLLRERPGLGAALFLVGVTCALTLLLQRSFRLDNPDVTGYSLPLLGAIFLLSLATLAILSRILAERYRPAAFLGIVLAALLLVANGWTTGRSLDRSGCHAGRTLAVRSLTLQPADALLLLADFNLVFMFDYLTQVEGVRPDVKILYLRDLDNPALRARLGRTDPALEALLPGSAGLDRSAVERISTLRPVALDLGPQVEERDLSPLQPAGLTWLVGPSDLKADPALFDIAPVCSTGDRNDRRTAEVIAWHAYWQARSALLQGEPELSHQLLSVAHCASPADRTIGDALAAIGSQPPLPCLAPTAGPPPSLPGEPHTPLARLPACLLLLGLVLWSGPLLGTRRFPPKHLRTWLVICCGIAFMVVALVLR